MFAYVTVGSSDFEASLKFFDATLGVLGYVRLQEYLDVGWVAYGNPQEASNLATPLLWLNRTPFNGQAATVGNGSMVSFSAISRQQVDQFYAVALTSGGSSEGAPGTREAYGPELYLAYVRDPTGNKFSVMTRAT